MTHLYLVIPALLQAAMASALPSQVGPRVAVAPFTVEHDSAGVLRAVADTCLERLVKALTANGIVVTRVPELSVQRLRNALPAPWAVLGRFTRENGEIRAELRLLEVASGDELRSYMNSGRKPEVIADLGVAAAPRIVAAIRGQ